MNVKVRKNLYNLAYWFDVIGMILNIGLFVYSVEMLFINTILAIFMIIYSGIKYAWYIPMALTAKKAAVNVGTKEDKSHMALGICTLLFCGLVSGILIIVGASKIDSDKKTKDAKNTNKKAAVKSTAIKTKAKKKITWQAFTLISGALVTALFFTIAFLMGSLSGAMPEWYEDYDFYNGTEIAVVSILWILVPLSILALFFNKKPARSGIFSMMFIVTLLMFALGLTATMFDQTMFDEYDYDDTRFMVAILLEVFGYLIGLITESVWFGIENKKDNKRKIAAGLKKEKVKTKPNGVQIATLVFVVLLFAAVFSMGMFYMVMMMAEGM